MDEEAAADLTIKKKKKIARLLWPCFSGRKQPELQTQAVRAKRPLSAEKLNAEWLRIEPVEAGRSGLKS